MGCHLHELAENMLVGKTEWYTSLTDNEVIVVVNAFLDNYENAVCFDGGSIDSFIDGGYKRIDELVELPFDICWVEFSVVDSSIADFSIICFLLIKQKDGFIALNFKRQKNKNDWMFDFSCFRPKRGGLEVSICDKSGIIEDAIRNQMELISRFLTAINCVNIEIVEEKPDKKIQKKRKKRGKVPLFSRWTLHIKINKSINKQNNYGRSHASPRIHLRRGHARRLRSGVYCWVSACIVGNKENGIIHKDYKVIN